MKNMLLIFTLIFGFIFILGCGKDGEEGKAFLSFTWDNTARFYDDDNGATPEDTEQGILPNTNYETAAGSYDFAYVWTYDDIDYYVSEGTYDITVNAGETGGLISDGANGEDNYFTLGLYADGEYEFGLNKGMASKLYLNSNTIDMSNYNKIPVGEMTTETYKSANGFMIVKKQMYKLILK